jgi:hypothetical protein
MECKQESIKASTINLVTTNHKKSTSVINAFISTIERKNSFSRTKQRKQSDKGNQINLPNKPKLVDPAQDIHNKTIDCINNESRYNINKNEESTIDNKNLDNSLYQAVEVKQAAILILKDNSELYDLNCDTNQTLCRVCYEGNTPEKGVLIYPCQCLGSVRLIHDSCLKIWIENNIFNNNFKARPECELCKFKYIMKFTFKYEFSKIKFWKMMRSLATMILIITIILTLAFIIIYLVVSSIAMLSDLGKNNLINILVSVGCGIIIIVALSTLRNARLNYHDRFIEEWKIYNLNGIYF